jgi:hypothetical protein
MVVADKYTCDMYYSYCPYRDDKFDTSKELGHKKPYYRQFCKSQGLYDGKPCRHAYKNNKRIAKRKVGHPLNGECVTVGYVK